MIRIYLFRVRHSMPWPKKGDPITAPPFADFTQEVNNGKGKGTTRLPLISGYVGENAYDVSLARNTWGYVGCHLGGYLSKVEYMSDGNDHEVWLELEPGLGNIAGHGPPFGEGPPPAPGTGPN